MKKVCIKIAKEEMKQKRMNEKQYMCDKKKIKHTSK